jgi:hypothetical protein
MKMLVCTLPPTLLKLSVELWRIGASSTQSWPGSFGLPLAWSTQRCFKRLPLCQWPRSEGSGACLACHSSKPFFSEGIKKACMPLNQVYWKEGDCVEKWCSCKFHITVIFILKIHCRFFLNHPHIFIYIYNFCEMFKGQWYRGWGNNVTKMCLIPMIVQTWILI